MKHSSKVLFCVAVLLMVAAIADAEVFRTLCTRARAHTHTPTRAQASSFTISEKNTAVVEWQKFLVVCTFFASHVLLQCTREARLLTRRFSPQVSAAELLPKKRWFRFWRKVPTEEKPQGDSTTPIVITARHTQHAHHKQTTKNNKNTQTHSQTPTPGHTHAHTHTRSHAQRYTTCCRLTLSPSPPPPAAGYRCFTYLS
jgi:hypothetical protein